LIILALLAFAIVTAHSMEHTEAVDRKGLNVILQDLHFFCLAGFKLMQPLCVCNFHMLQ